MVVTTTSVIVTVVFVGMCVGFLGGMLAYLAIDAHAEAAAKEKTGY